MKTILITLLTVLMLSCKNNTAIEIPPPYNDAPTQFIVTDIQQMDGMKTLTTYYVEVVDVNGLSHSEQQGTSENLKFWFCDSLGKYKLGQPIHFDKFR